jgi:hypothetical protein
MDMYGLGSAGAWSEGMADSAIDSAKLGGSVLVGAAAAQFVVKQLSGMLPAGMAADYGAPLAPIVVGLASFHFGKKMYPIAAPGVGAGMVAVGLGKLIGAAVKQFVTDPKTVASVKDYVPFAGLGYTYDSPLMGLGYSYGAGVDAYMHGAPTQVQSLMGAPTQVQSLMGMPVQVQSLSGLGSTIVGSGAPMSAALM